MVTMVTNFVNGVKITFPGERQNQGIPLVCRIYPLEAMNVRNKFHGRNISTAIPTLLRPLATKTTLGHVTNVT